MLHGALLIARGRIAEGLEPLGEAERAADVPPRLHAEIGLLHARSRRWRPCACATTRRAPSSCSASRWRTGETERAVRALETSLRYAPAGADARAWLARLGRQEPR